MYEEDEKGLKYDGESHGIDLLDCVHMTHKYICRIGQLITTGRLKYLSRLARFQQYI